MGFYKIEAGGDFVLSHVGSKAKVCHDSLSLSFFLKRSERFADMALLSVLKSNDRIIALDTKNFLAENDIGLEDAEARPFSQMELKLTGHGARTATTQLA